MHIYIMWVYRYMMYLEQAFQRAIIYGFFYQDGPKHLQLFLQL